MSVENRIRKILPRFIELIQEERRIHYTKLMTEFNLSLMTANRYARELAARFPNNLLYVRGEIILVKPFSEDEIPIELRYEAQKKTIEALSRMLKEKEEKEEKLKRNHLPHLGRAVLERDLEKIHKELERLRKFLEEGEEVT